MWWTTLVQLMQGYSLVLPMWVCSIWCNNAIWQASERILSELFEHAVSLCRQYPASEPFLNQATL